MPKFFINILVLIVIASSGNKADAQVATNGKLMFGLNMPYLDQDFVKMVSDTVNYTNFFRDYHIQYMRWPGGTAARNFIYYSSDLSNQARAMALDYYQMRGKKKVIENGSANREPNFNFPPNYYEKFLEFCVNNKVQPLITLSTNYYAYNNKVYQVAPFLQQPGDQKHDKLNNKNAGAGAGAAENLGENLRKYLTDQINFTHKKIQKVTWEIGNEEYYMYSGSIEGDIVNFYVNIIKSLYPQDEIIVSFANSSDEKGGRDKWNDEFINKLVQYRLLSKINYFAPHFYVDVYTEDKTDQDIQKRISDIDIPGFEKKMLSYFPAGYTPHFFVTEFSVYLGMPHDNANVNSNIHALMMFYYLMNFYSCNSIDGIIYHVFLGKTPFIYLQSDPAAFNNNIVSKTTPYKNISTIPIQTQAEQIFYKNVGEKFVKFVKDGNLYILVTQTAGKNIYFILNLSSAPATIDRNKIVQSLQDDTELSFINYNFEDWNLKSNSLNSQITKKRYKDFTSMDVHKYSLLVVK